MSEKKDEAHAPPEFVVLYEKLRTADAEATVRTTRLMQQDMAATDEVARMTASDEWPFTTYVST